MTGTITEYRRLAYFRPSTHLFYLNYDGNGVWNGPAVDRSFSFGITEDVPISGDRNNNGISENRRVSGLRHTCSAWITTGTVSGTDLQWTDRSFGITGDIPISGDWNNDGISETGMFTAFNAPVLPGLQRERCLERTFSGPIVATLA